MFDIPSHVGVREVIQSTADNTVLSDNNKARKEYFIDTNKLGVPRPDTDVVSFLKDGMIEDWEIFEEMVDYVTNKCLMCDPKEHPLLFSEPPWNSREKREKLMEIAFEKYEFPAVYLMKNAVLSLFASGRSSGLVIDCGATHTSAVPIHDGYVISNNVVTQQIGGNTIVDQCRLCMDKQEIELVPGYKIASKQEVTENKKPVWKLKSNLPTVTKSFDDYFVRKILEDFAHSTLQLCDTPIDVDFVDKLPAASYGFPCGFRKDFLSERAKIPESLFDLKYLHTADNKPAPSSTLMNVSDIAAAACGMCENDIRTQMYSNVFVSGGTSLIMGFPERLNHDLALRCPPVIKLRVAWAQTMAECRFGAWIGGSIVACQPVFYQYWVSKAEYKELGRSAAEKRCT
uniref:Actin-like protein 6A n=1 Tax=Panagrellus redivivus TaxID=6233 RepID=A0A7E4VUT1_PANRE